MENPILKSQVDTAIRTTGVPHHSAIQRLADLAAPGSMLETMRKRRVMVRANKDRIKQEEVFTECVKYLMEGTRWTFGNMAAYQRKVLDLIGATGWRRRFSSDDPSVLHLEKELRVLDAMTPVELASNHKSVFTREAKKMIAEKANVSEKFVDQVIIEHDVLRGDRRWYMILKQFDKPLPRTFQDRQFLAEFDRPLSASEAEMRQKMIDDETSKMVARGYKPKRTHYIYYRKPTCGGNRWSTRPPRWFPSRWKTRPERKQREGGEHRRPWGRLVGVPSAMRK